MKEMKLIFLKCSFLLLLFININIVSNYIFHNFITLNLQIHSKDNINLILKKKKRKE